MNINTAVSQDGTLCHLGDRCKELVTVGPGQSTQHCWRTNIVQTGFCPLLRFSPSVSVHQCSALFIHLLLRPC